MKISLGWLLDHIDAPKACIDITHLVTRFNQVTAEIEGYEKIELPLDHISCAHVIAHNTLTITVKSVEWDIECILPTRTDIDISSPVPTRVLIYKETSVLEPILYRWVTLNDMGSSKEGLMPPVYLEPTLYDGSWKKRIEKIDFILHVDNKSLTHRPDMWGHRGFAREVAALFDLPLKPITKLLTQLSIQEADTHGATGPIHVTIQDPTCDRFAGLSIATIEYRPSFIEMALRLTRIDCRPFNALVDMTNYVMFDLGQPMHAFDADTLPTKNIVIRKAHNKEKLTLRKGESIELTSHDTIISDATTPICLAGVTGDGTTAITSHTHSILLIAEHFNPTAIRLTAARHKIRTEASARFEKNIDPTQTITALERFLYLCDTISLPYSITVPLISLGKKVESHTITIEHAFIEQRLGVSIDSSFVTHILHKLSFDTMIITVNNELKYTITIPSFRATKDIRLKEDIVEEIGRFYGYNTIPLQLPHLSLAAKNTQTLKRMRAIKQLLSEACSMRELYTYSFYDESFLRRLAWAPLHSLSVQNPVSENWQRLVTSLIPNLIKAVSNESAEHDQLRFFELARIWNPSDLNNPEKEVLTGIVFEKKQEINFYNIKQIIQKIADLIQINLAWIAVENPEKPWFSPYKTARILNNSTCVGYMGMVPESFLHTVTEGHAYVFELDATFLRAYQSPITHYKPSSPYPLIKRDISMLVPLSMTTDHIISLIAQSDSRIIETSLIDFFEKKEWLNQRSLTIHIVLCDMEKTMTKEEVDTIIQAIAIPLAHRGVIIR